MVTKSRKATVKKEPKGGKLKLNKETVKNLTGKGKKPLKRGPGATMRCATLDC